VIPNLLVSGVLASLLSLVFIPCAIWIARRRHGAWALLGLSAAMLLVGAGFGPPFLGAVLGIAAAQIHASGRGWPARLPAGLRRRLAAAWPWLFGVCLAAWLLLSPGSAVLGYFFGVDSLALVPVLFFTALIALLLSIAAGLVRDAQPRTPPSQSSLH
jgi:ABC-type Na+ efflux pump permease subunit